MTLLETATLLNVESNFAFLPHVRVLDGKPTPVTMCNAFASVFCAARGVSLPPDLANKQMLYLMAHPLDWEQVVRDRALELANLHQLVLPVAEHAEHGHIAACVESPADDPTHLYVAAAGANCFRRARLESSFGFLSPLFFHFKGVPYV